MMPIIDDALPFTAVKPESCDDDAQFRCFVAYGRKSKPALTIASSTIIRFELRGRLRAAF
jgi:hypothetical protein